MALIKLNNRGVRNVSTFGSVGGGSMTFIKKLTASSSATLSFVDGSSDVVLDDTYKEYMFTFNNIHPETDAANFLFQGNAAGGSGYNETMTTTVFRAYHNETDADTNLYYGGDHDQAQGTSFQMLMDACDNDNDSCLAGSLRLFNPSNTTFVKHFIADCQAVIGTYSQESFTAGYFNTTSAIDEIQFKFHTGDIDAGDICLYGIK